MALSLEAEISYSIANAKASKAAKKNEKSLCTEMT